VKGGKTQATSSEGEPGIRHEKHVNPPAAALGSGLDGSRAVSPWLRFQSAESDQRSTDFFCSSAYPLSRDPEDAGDVKLMR